MNNFQTRMTGFMLVFGIFFTLSCTSLKSSSDNAEALYNKNNYGAALEVVDREISENPDNSELKVLKAKILKDYAANDRVPSNRDLLYNNLRHTVDEIQFSSDQYKSVTDSILNSAWFYEQGEGVRLLQQDGTETIDRHFDRVISHFSNAIIINPDSLVTYNLKATTYYRHGDLIKAIETLESIEGMRLKSPPETYEKLAYLYLEAGMIDRSIDVYEKLVSENPQSEVYRQGLANAYILGDKHQLSIELLDALSEEYPNRIEYREALATERFYQLQIEATDLVSSEAPNSTEEVKYFTDSLNEITSIYNEVDSALPASEERKERIAEFHLSAANLLMEIAEGTDSETESNQLATSENKKHLQHAIPYLRALFESNAENIAYAQKLIRVYNNLEMDHEAELLERQINF